MGHSVILNHNIPVRKRWSYCRIATWLVRIILISCTEPMTKSFPHNRCQSQDPSMRISHAKTSTFPAPLTTAWSFSNPKMSKLKKILIQRIRIEIKVVPLVKHHQYKIIVSLKQRLLRKMRRVARAPKLSTTSLSRFWAPTLRNPMLSSMDMSTLWPQARNALIISKNCCKKSYIPRWLISKSL